MELYILYCINGQYIFSNYYLETYESKSIADLIIKYLVMLISYNKYFFPAVLLKRYDIQAHIANRHYFSNIIYLTYSEGGVNVLNICPPIVQI